MTPTEPDANDEASLTEGLGRALRQPWKLTHAWTLGIAAFAERYATGHGLAYQAKGEIPRTTWFLNLLYEPRSHSFMRGSLDGGTDELLFYGIRPVGAGRSSSMWTYMVAVYAVESTSGLGDALACVPYSPPVLGGHVKFESQLPPGLARAPIDGGPFDERHEVGTTGSVDPARLQALFSTDFVSWMQTLATGDKESIRFDISRGSLCVYTWQTLNTTQELDVFVANARRIVDQVERATSN